MNLNQYLPEDCLETPVAFLIFNRADTTATVFEAIRRARPPKLLVVADGPRDNRPGEHEACQATRAIIDRVDWPCEVLTNFSEVNLGCKPRISTGLTWVFDQVPEAIILEDDCLPHPDFFMFCQRMLRHYRDDERVMMITGTNYLLDKLSISESYCFSRYFAIWGWATWQRAWRNYDIAMEQWQDRKKEGLVEACYSQSFMRRHVTRMFDLAYRNEIDTWDIQWFYTCLALDGVSIVPKVNLISNIGLFGTHTSNDHSNNLLPTFALDPGELKHPRDVLPSPKYDPVFFRQKLWQSPASRLKELLRRLKRRVLPH